ncbi:hypothetical protein [Vitreimonas flagellata]|uniref:hypothetical protein n=1 Tax=Vitreimonas flagellata TaxID=2560861 RepID=UPI001075071C|nr:hypothetical protein [Vitreimonas flagellata]
MAKPFTATLLGGLVAGALDITYACAHWNIAHDVAPQRIFQSVAAGLLGRDAAVAGGWNTAALGLALHFVMTTIMAAFFVAASRAAPALNRTPLLSGIVYGLGLYAVMNFIVVPFSAAGDGVIQAPEFNQFFYGGLLAHTLLVGVPIALIAKRFEN